MNAMEMVRRLCDAMWVATLLNRLRTDRTSSEAHRRLVATHGAAYDLLRRVLAIGGYPATVGAIPRDAAARDRIAHARATVELAAFLMSMYPTLCEDARGGFVTDGDPPRARYVPQRGSLRPVDLVPSIDVARWHAMRGTRRPVVPYRHACGDLRDVEHVRRAIYSAIVATHRASGSIHAVVGTMPDSFAADSAAFIASHAATLDLTNLPRAIARFAYVCDGAPDIARGCVTLDADGVFWYCRVSGGRDRVCVYDCVADGGYGIDVPIPYEYLLTQVCVPYPMMRAWFAA